jgi:predicted DsbA family dithiol-disulfide isomerase
MKIEIWSDIVCPFCYIGKRRFEIALSQMPFKEKVKVIWRSYQLDPQMKNIPGQDIHDMLADKKGQSREWAKEMNNYVSNMAKEVGLNYQMDKVIPSNTLLAHCLTHLASKYNLQDKMEERLFSAYFTEGKNLEDIETLVLLGQEVGLDLVEVRQVLQSEEYKKEVYNEQYFAQNIGIQGVPFFLMNEKYGVSGAQPVELFIKALTQSYQEWEGQPSNTLESSVQEGNTCSTEEGCDL